MPAFLGEGANKIGTRQSQASRRAEHTSEKQNSYFINIFRLLYIHSNRLFFYATPAKVSRRGTGASMLGRQFSRELEQVHTVHDLAPHLERFLNAGYAVRREPNGGFVLLPDTIALEPFQSFVFELLADDHHGKYFGSRAKNLMRHLTYLIALCFTGRSSAS